VDVAENGRFRWVDDKFAKSDVANVGAAIAAGFILSFAICTLLAWLAMRYDWGRKSRY